MHAISCTKTISFLLGVPFLVASGCGNTGLNGLVSVRGTVRYNNAPVAAALVSFSPVRSDVGLRSASATTDSEGRFVLTTLRPNDGVMPGEYKVTVKKLFEEPDNTVKSLLPSKYSDKEKSDLAITVTSRGNDGVAFDLKD